MKYEKKNVFEITNKYEQENMYKYVDEYIKIVEENFAIMKDGKPIIFVECKKWEEHVQDYITKIFVVT